MKAAILFLEMAFPFSGSSSFESSIFFLSSIGCWMRGCWGKGTTVLVIFLGESIFAVGSKVTDFVFLDCIIEWHCKQYLLWWNNPFSGAFTLMLQSVQNNCSKYYLLHSLHNLLFQVIWNALLQLEHFSFLKTLKNTFIN